MTITIRNQWLLKKLGFHPAYSGARMVAGMSIRLWLQVIRRQITKVSRDKAGQS